MLIMASRLHQIGFFSVKVKISMKGVHNSITQIVQDKICGQELAEINENTPKCLMMILRASCSIFSSWKTGKHDSMKFLFFKSYFKYSLKLNIWIEYIKTK